jgi:hypothetical protein
MLAVDVGRHPMTSVRSCLLGIGISTAAKYHGTAQWGLHRSHPALLQCTALQLRGRSTGRCTAPPSCRQVLRSWSAYKHAQRAGPSCSRQSTMTCSQHRSAVWRRALGPELVHQVHPMPAHDVSGTWLNSSSFFLQAGRRGILYCTQPRRAAATETSKRVAQEFGTNLGGLVGYCISGGHYMQAAVVAPCVKILMDGHKMSFTPSDMA